MKWSLNHLYYAKSAINPEIGVLETRVRFRIVPVQHHPFAYIRGKATNVNFISQIGFSLHTTVCAAVLKWSTL